MTEVYIIIVEVVMLQSKMSRFMITVDVVLTTLRPS
jgi:hypothetical protein